MQESKPALGKLTLDRESPIVAICALLLARTISSASDHVFLQTFSILLSFVPLLILSFKIVLFLEGKNVFTSSNSGIRFSLFGLLLVPIVYVPITLLSYLTPSYVFTTLVLVTILTILGTRLPIGRALYSYLESIRKDFVLNKHSFVVFLQLGLLLYLSFYLESNQGPVTPGSLGYLPLSMLIISIGATLHLLLANSKLKEFSIIITASFLFMFLAIQGTVTFGGDSGFSVSITKYLLNGNPADVISPNDRWRFGSGALLGFPSLSAFLAESSQVNPDYALSYANAIGLVFILIGAFLFRNLLGRNEFEKSLILAIFLLALPATYFFNINSFRPISLLLLELPLVIPLFLHLNFNKFGKIAFLLAMFSIVIVHPLAFVFIIIMLVFLYYKSARIGRLTLLGIVSAFLVIILLFAPVLLRALSISPEQPPSFSFSPTIFGPLVTSFPAISSSEWPSDVTFKISLAATLFALFLLVARKVENIPRVPMISLIGLFFILSFFVQTPNFPIMRLSIVFGNIGLVIISLLLIRKFQIHRIYSTENSSNKWITKTITLVLISILVTSIVTNSFPQGRALKLDTLKFQEYELLKGFIETEKDNLNHSLIFAHIETMRYLNGMEGSILYYNNATKPFLFDFTDRSEASTFYEAFSSSLSGDLSDAVALAIEKNAQSIYIVILYRLLPNFVDNAYGNLVASNDAGMVRKISLTSLDGLEWQMHARSTTYATVFAENEGISLEGTFSKNFTSAQMSAKVDTPINSTILINYAYNGSLTPRFFFVLDNDMIIESGHGPVNGSSLSITSPSTKSEIHELIVSLDSGQQDQFGRQISYPVTETIRVNRVFYIN